MEERLTVERAPERGKQAQRPEAVWPSRSRFRRFVIPLILLAAIATAVFLIWKIFFARPGPPENVTTLSGRIEGDDSALAPKTGGRILEIRFREGDRVKDEERWRVSLFGDRLHVITDEDAERGIQTTTEKLEANGIHVRDAREGRFSMEDVFISVVEKARQEGKVAAED